MPTIFQKPVLVIALRIIAVCSSQFAAVAGISSLIMGPLLLEDLVAGLRLTPAPPEPQSTVSLPRYSSFYHPQPLISYPRKRTHISTRLGLTQEEATGKKRWPNQPDLRPRGDLGTFLGGMIHAMAHKVFQDSWQEMQHLDKGHTQGCFRNSV